MASRIPRARLTTALLAAATAILAPPTATPVAAPPSGRASVATHTLDRVVAPVTEVGDRRVTVPVSRSPEEIQLFARREGGLESAPERVEAAAERGSVLDLDRGTSYVLRTGTPTEGPARLTREGFVLPDRLLYSPTVDEHPGPEPPLRSFALFLALQEDPVPWRDDADAYGTALLAGLVEIDADSLLTGGAPAMPALDPPLVVRFTGTHSRVQPPLLEIVQAGTAGFRTAELTVPRAAAGAGVHAVSDLGDAELTFDVAAGDVTLQLGAENEKIHGWGVGVTDLTVTRQRADGTPLTEGDLEIDFGWGDGLLDAPERIADGQAKARARLRSEGSGSTSVIARASSSIVSNPVTITFEPPWVLVLVTLAGALLGGLAGWAQERARRLRAQFGPPGLGRRIFLGLVAGFFVEAVITLGLWKVEWLDLARTELGAAVFSFVGGWLGTAVIDRILGLLGFPERAAREP